MYKASLNSNAVIPVSRQFAQEQFCTEIDPTNVAWKAFHHDQSSQ